MNDITRHLTKEEIEELKKMAPETSWSRAHQRLNDMRKIKGLETINQSWLFNKFLKSHGCRDGKMAGFKFKDKEFLSHDDVPEIQQQTVVEEMPSNQTDVQSADQIPSDQTVVQSSESLSDTISKNAMIVLKMIHKSDKINKSDFIEQHKLNPKKVHEATKELKDAQIIRSIGRRLQHNMTRAEREEMFPELREYNVFDVDMEPIMTRKGIEALQLKNSTQTRTWDELDVGYIKDTLDKMDPMSTKEDVNKTIRDLMTHYDVKNTERDSFMKKLVELGILSETVHGEYMIKDKPHDDLHPEHNIPDNSEHDVPDISVDQIKRLKQIVTAKDVVLECSNIRIRNVTGRQIQVIVKDNEVVLKV